MKHKTIRKGKCFSFFVAGVLHRLIFPGKPKIDRRSCKNSCFDTVFRGKKVSKSCSIYILHVYDCGKIDKIENGNREFVKDKQPDQRTENNRRPPIRCTLQYLGYKKIIPK